MAAKKKGAGKGGPCLCFALFCMVVALTFGIVVCVCRGWVVEDGGKTDIQIGIWKGWINGTDEKFEDFFTALTPQVLSPTNCLSHLERSTRAVRAMNIIGICFAFFGLICAFAGYKAPAASLGGAICSFMTWATYLTAWVIIYVVWGNQSHCESNVLVAAGIFILPNNKVKFLGTKWGYCHWLMLVAWLLSLVAICAFLAAYSMRPKPRPRFPPDEEFPVPQFPVNYPVGQGYPAVGPVSYPAIAGPYGPTFTVPPVGNEAAFIPAQQGFYPTPYQSQPAPYFPPY